MGKSTSNCKVEAPQYIEIGDQAEVEFIPQKPLIATEFDLCQPFGRFIALDHNLLVLLGKIIVVEHYR